MSHILLLFVNDNSFEATGMEAGSPQMGVELGSDLINIERNLPCLLMATEARQIIHSEHKAAGSY